MYRDDVNYYIRIDEGVSRLSWGDKQRNALKALREAKGYTRKEFAETLASAGEFQIRKLEIGAGKDEVKAISGELLIEICKVLDVDPSCLGYPVSTSPK
jgi:transcriptional regulator with XRE-family HTH domain